MKVTKLTGAIAAVLIGAAGAASAGAVISDGNVKLGVNDLGHLNFGSTTADVAGETVAGVRWIAPTGAEYESTSHGCYCEGWGLAVTDAGGTDVGYADRAGGIGGLTLVNFTSTATTAESVVKINGTDVEVSHKFALAAETDDLFRVTVTISNKGATDVTGLEYRRVMDWDTSPTPFSEFVTIKGTATTTLLSTSSDDGFDGGNPLSTPSDLAGCGIKVDFTDCGSADHGAVFDFALGGVGAGEAYSFDIFYGGAGSNAAALAALGAVGAELYSTGRSYLDVNGDGKADSSSELTPTFIFAFKGVGGTVIVPPPTPGVPLPAAGWLMIAGLGGLAALRRGRKAA